MASSSSNVVGVHYRVGKKIGEGSFGVIFEGTNLLNNQQVAIKFVRCLPLLRSYLGAGIAVGTHGDHLLICVRAAGTSKERRPAIARRIQNV